MKLQRFVLDASIILGYLNEEDKHHRKCSAFMEKIDARKKRGEKVQIVLPLHLVIEVQINIRKRKGNKSWKGIAPFESGGVKAYKVYPIDFRFLKHIREEGLYDKFSELKSSDAIYAMIAYIEKIPLVTVDSHFDKVQDIIDVIFL